jgi:N-acetylglucosamine malate deacetylase 2
MEKRLLCAFAHPDDESYGPAGTIREVSGRIDGRVRIVVATRGDAGSLGISKQFSPGELARVRQSEMLQAARVLEAEAVFLGYPDKHVAAMGEERGVEDLVREIRLFRPQVLVTFHPNGISGHEDHKAMTRYATAAFHAAADPAYRLPASHEGHDTQPWATSRLFYYGFAKSRATAIEHLRTIHAIEDEEADLTIDNTPHLARKHAACLAHGTQQSLYSQLQQAIGGLDAFWSREHLVLAATAGKRPAAPLAHLMPDDDPATPADR